MFCFRFLRVFPDGSEVTGSFDPTLILGCQAFSLRIPKVGMILSICSVCVCVCSFWPDVSSIFISQQVLQLFEKFDLILLLSLKWFHVTSFRYEMHGGASNRFNNKRKINIIELNAADRTSARIFAFSIFRLWKTYSLRVREKASKKWP